MRISLDYTDGTIKGQKTRSASELRFNPLG